MIPGDKELQQLVHALGGRGSAGVVQTFLMMNAENQRNAANRSGVPARALRSSRLLQETQSCDDELLHCPEFTQVASALGLPDVFQVPSQPHPFKCQRLCRSQICPVCLMCAGPNGHCFGAKNNGTLCCEKRELACRIADLSWWIPGVDVELGVCVSATLTALAGGCWLCDESAP